MPGLLTGQTIVVTGGGTGIGRCIAHEVASLGATAVILGRRDHALKQTVEEIHGMGGNAHSYQVDIRDEEASREIVTNIVERHGAISGLVNNAGGQFPSLAKDLSSRGWRAVVELNLTSTFLICQHVYQASMAEHGGSIVSVVANMWNGFPYMSHTGAARAGVVNLTKTLSLEWASQGIRVNAVAPGVIYSSGMETYDSAVLEDIAAQARSSPARRVGTESEVSSAVTFLLSAGASYITGETIRIDGGASLMPETIHPLPSGSALGQYNGFPLARNVPPEWAR